MSVYLPFYGFFITAITFAKAAWDTTASTELTVLAGFIGGILGLALWVYSPLPSTNGGWGAPPARMQKWGWTNEPAHEYEEPTAEDRMAIPPSGFMFAERSPEDDDDS